MSKDQAKTPPTEKAPAASTTPSDSSASSATSAEAKQPAADPKPVAEKPSSLPATTPTGEAPKQPQYEKLPEDRWPHNRKEPVNPKGDAELSAEQVAFVDKSVEFLMASPDHWKTGLPEPLSAWTALRETLPSGTRPMQTSDVDLSALRRLLSDQIICRIYPGITSKERLLVIRCVGTTYARMELVPWTRGK